MSTIFLEDRLQFEYEEGRALKALKHRLHHYMDGCFKRNLVAEADSDISEDVMVDMVLKMCGACSHVDLMTGEDELHALLINRLLRDLPDCCMVESGAASTELRGRFKKPNSKEVHEFSLSVGPLSFFLHRDFERIVRGGSNEKRGCVFFRTEALFLDSSGLLDPLPLDTATLELRGLLIHIAKLADQEDEPTVQERMREFVTSYADSKELRRVLLFRVGELVRSAFVLRHLTLGTHYDTVNHTDRSTRIVLAPHLHKAHWGLQQLLELQLLAKIVTPVAAPSDALRTPLHLLKSYGKRMGVIRRGGYELARWIPIFTQLGMNATRLYPTESSCVVPRISIDPSPSIADWSEQVAQVMGEREKIPQSGARIIVCPSRAALDRLRHHLHLCSDEYVASLPLSVCGTVDELERTVLAKRTTQRLITVLTTAAQFDHWHMRYIGSMVSVTVLLGTPRSEARHLHRAYRFARPIINVVTVPLEPSSAPTPNDSGVDLDSSCSSEEDAVMRAQVLGRVENRSQWANVFMKEMGDSGVNWYEPLRIAEDEKYEKRVEWMKKEWAKEEHKVTVVFSKWSKKMMDQYRLIF